jgi:hypothetical protein
MSNLPLIRETLSGIAGAVEDELRAAAGDPSSRFLLRDGRQIGRSGSKHLWSFEFDGELPLGPESMGELIVEGRDPLIATVIAIGDLDLVLSVGDELGMSVATAVLVGRPLFILEALRGRLEDAAAELLDCSMLEQLLDLSSALDDDPEEDEDPTRPDPSEYSDSSDELDRPTENLSHEQLMAAEHATREGLRFVWGPPGTGKTSTLAAAVAALAGSGLRVMVLAHSNAAVDVAMVRIASFMAGSPALDNDQVLRIGTPHLAEARDCAAILPDEIVARRFPELGTQRRNLENQRTQLSGEIRAGNGENAALVAELEQVRKALTDIDNKLVQGQAELIQHAQVVGCTLAKVVIDPQLWAWNRDAIIIDEASMASLPTVMALASNPPQTLACFGDFRQLPPIGVSDRPGAKAWFGRDVFELAGVVSRFIEGHPDPRLSILRTQYRMGETIATAVSDVAYFSLLSSHTDAISRAQALAAHSPLAGHEVAIIDTSVLHPICLRDIARRSFSRFSLHSAAVTATLANQAAGDGLEVGVMSPYRAQVAVMAALLRKANAVTTATTHRFQGAERDAIIIDLVDSAPEKGPSRLTGQDAELALRLLNVGISRAKGKVLIVVDLPFLRSQSPKGSPALQFIDAFAALGAPVVAASELIDGVSTPTTDWSTDWWTAVTELVRTGKTSSLQIGLDDTFLGDPELPERLQQLKTLVSRLTVHAPMEIAADLDHRGFDIRLLPLGAGPLAICKGKGVVVGGFHPSSSTLTLRGAALTNTLLRLLEREA